MAEKSERVDEATRLRGSLRDLISFSALSTIWASYESERIPESLADALRKTLDLRFVQIRLCPRSSGGRFETVHRDDLGTPTGSPSPDLVEALDPWVADPFRPAGTIPDPADGRPLRVAATRFGSGDGVGIIVTASRRPDFPTEHERLLVAIAANQTALGIRRIADDRQRREVLLREREALREATTLNELSLVVGAELDLQAVVQKITDASTELTGAAFGAFFYNAVDEKGESYLLYALSGASRESFDGFGLPRNTELFGPTFRGEGVVRLDDVLSDPRYGKNAPFRGTPKGHLPVRSYLAAPVVSRDGVVVGGLFFGHPKPGRFTERAERLVRGIAAQAAVAIDNARLYGQAQSEIDERRKAEESERAARTEAERATRVRDEFLATLSHELRTPLNGILGWTHVLRQGDTDESVRSRAVDAIERGARAQARLIDDLLDMSRIMAGKLRLDVQSVDLLSLLEDAIETLRPAAEGKQIRIQLLMDPLAGPIKGDPGRLQQVFWNLLSNAVKFTPKGGRIQVHLERVNSQVEISVSDSGCGISPEFLPYIFDRFRQADGTTTRRFAGLGLGLAVAKHLVELHGGVIRATSAGEGRGSTFSVQLPVAIVRHDPLGREHPAAYRGPDEDCEDLKLENPLVVVVDDDEEACELVERILIECGARVVSTTSAAEALRRLEESRPDIVLCDIGMPEMDGYEFVRRLRSRDSALPAVAVTAFARSEDRVRALRAGYNAHLAKPVDPRELVTVIASLVRPIPPSDPGS